MNSSLVNYAEWSATQLRNEVVKRGLASAKEVAQGTRTRKVNLIRLLEDHDSGSIQVEVPEGHPIEGRRLRSRSLSPPRVGSRNSSQAVPTRRAAENVAFSLPRVGDTGEALESTRSPISRSELLPQLPPPRNVALVPDPTHFEVDSSSLPDQASIRGRRPQEGPGGASSQVSGVSDIPHLLDSRRRDAPAPGVSSLSNQTLAYNPASRDDIQVLLHRQIDMERALSSISMALQRSDSSHNVLPLSEQHRIKAKWNPLPTSERASWEEAEKLGHRGSKWWTDTGMMLDEIKWRLENGNPPTNAVLLLDELMAHCRFRSQYNRTLMVEGVEVAEKFAEQPVPMDLKSDLEKLLKLARKSVERVKKSGSNTPICFNCLRPGHVSTHCSYPTAPGANSLLAAGRGRGRGFNRGNNSSEKPTPTKSA